MTHYIPIGRNGKRITRGDILCKGTSFVGFWEITQTGQVRIAIRDPYRPGQYLMEVVHAAQVGVRIWDTQRKAWKVK